MQQWPRELSFETVFHSVNGMIAVFYEAIRMHPPVPLFLRLTIRECEIGGVRVPADTMVCIPGTYIHRLEEWWHDPDTFDPNRVRKRGRFSTKLQHFRFTRPLDNLRLVAR